MKHIIRKRISLIIVMLLTFTLAAACEKQAGDEISGKGVKMYLTVSSADEFRTSLIEAAKKTAEEIGATLDVHDAEGSLESQLEQIREAVKEEYDVILCNPVDVDTTLQLQVEAGELPIVFYNSCPDDSLLKADKYVYVGSNEADAGKYQAEYILEKFSSKNTINVVIIEGELQHSATKGRTKALKQTLEDSGKTIHYVFDDTADWYQDKAKMLYELFLKTGQEADCVASNNDTMALGVVEACREIGVDFEAFPVLGVDATEDGCQSIEDGEMQFTVYQSAVGQGEYVVKAAAALAQGQSLKGMKYLSDDEKYVWVPFEKVDASNVKNYK